MSKRPHPTQTHRGGLRQRIQAASAVTAASSTSHIPDLAAAGAELCDAAPVRNEGFSSELVMHLLREWAWGHVSASKAQQLAKKSYDDQLKLLSDLGISGDRANPTLKRIASLGASGKFPNNCHAELLKYLGEPSTPAPMLHKVALQRLKISTARPDEIVEVDQPIFLPHVMFAHYYNNDRDRFNELFLGPFADPKTIESFWGELEKRKDDRLVDHPVKEDPAWRRCTIPLAFHGDGVPVLQVGKANTKSIEVYSFQSLFPAGLTTLKAKILMTMVFGKNFTDHTEDQLWTVLSWSFSSLAKGRWPSVDWNGESYPPDSSEARLGGTFLADGLRGILFSIKGDLDFLAKTLHLRHYNSFQMCELCPADRGTDRRYMYNNFPADAVWKERLHSLADWRALYGGDVPHPIFRVPGVSHFSLEPDELNVFYLGTVQYLLGSVLYLLAYHVMRGDPEENMRAVWTQVVDYYKQNSVATQFSQLGLASFCSVSSPHAAYPRLKGKGAECKDVVAPLAKIWRDITKAKKEPHRLVQTCLDNQVALQDILHESREELLMPAPVAAKFQRHVDELLVNYQKLAAAADQSGQLLWNQPTKWHWVWHLAAWAKFINPRRANTFIDEDFVGKMKDVVHSCATGSELHAMAVKGCHKYRWGFHFLGSAFQ